MMIIQYKQKCAFLCSVVKKSTIFAKNNPNIYVQSQMVPSFKRILVNNLCLRKQDNGSVTCFTRTMTSNKTSISVVSLHGGLPQKTLQILCWLPTLLNMVPYGFVAFKSTNSQLIKQRRKMKYPELNEDDLEEQFVRGSGPGGQSTNKTSNCVVLKHKPTGIIIKCHQTRSQHENQIIARRLLQEKLDQHLHGENSQINQQNMLNKKKQSEKKRKTRIKLEKLKELREKLNSENEK
ncbi:peptide chain release factor 2-like isoform X1 [Anneissia japonica]|uniref:peptide chain release factor 2-like isoform X1 n=1 Tax=Anneissia japonica TaxID=1529436 RepID=UPI0014257687|nr:peptide chain release factor 2-like isoform X1 [Anneissia japonica]XP_033115661.1 peptide chain release factor 2-like isoform X1 [Anneissia japonica]